jgi:hypothetical protein
MKQSGGDVFDPAKVDRLVYTGRREQYVLNMETWKCSCAFQQNYKLPCRHVIYLRTITRMHPIVPDCAIHKRWKWLSLHPQQQLVGFQEGEVDDSVEADPLIPERDYEVETLVAGKIKGRTISNTEMFCRFKQIAEDLCDMASHLDSRKFDIVEQEFAKFRDILVAGKIPKICENENGCNNNNSSLEKVFQDFQKFQKFRELTSASKTPQLSRLPNENEENENVAKCDFTGENGGSTGFSCKIQINDKEKNCGSNEEKCGSNEEETENKEKNCGVTGENGHVERFKINPEVKTVGRNRNKKKSYFGPKKTKKQPKQSKLKKQSKQLEHEKHEGESEQQENPEQSDFVDGLRSENDNVNANLVNLDEAVQLLTNSNPTFNQTKSLLSFKLKQFRAMYNPMCYNPVAAVISPQVNLLWPEDVDFILPEAFVLKAVSLFRSFPEVQRKRYYVDTEFGCMPLTTLQSMYRIWTRRKALKIVQKTIEWCQGMDESDEELLRRLENRCLVSSKSLGGSLYYFTEICSLRYMEYLNDVAIEMAIRRIAFVNRVELHVVPSTVLGERKHSEPPPLPAARSHLINILENYGFFQKKSGIVVLPVNINNNHWTCILVDLSLRKMVWFDSLHSRANERILTGISKDLVAPLLTDYPGFEKGHDTKYTQRDGHSCGIFVILFVQDYINRAEAISPTSAGALEKARFRIFKDILDHEEHYDLT